MTRLSAIALPLVFLLLVGDAAAAPYMIPPPPGALAPDAASDAPAPEAKSVAPAPEAKSVAPAPEAKSVAPAVQPDHPSGSAAAACANGADGFNNVLPGTSKVQGAYKQGDFWVLTMSSGTFRSLCTVSRNGQVMDVVTGGY